MSGAGREGWPERGKEREAGRHSSPGGAGRALACPFAACDGGRSRREVFNPAQLSPPGAWEPLPWISADCRAPAALGWGTCLG